jgi:acyl dehydratase
MESHSPTKILDNDKKDSLKNGIVVEKLSEIKEHVGETFSSEKIHVSEHTVRLFIEALGDINPIHFDLNRINESAFAKMSDGRIFVPGLLTQSLWCNKDVIYKALKIADDHEVTLKSIGGTKFVAPVFADSDLVFKLKLNAAKDCTISSRNGVETDWEIISYTKIGEKMRIAMITEVTLIYTSLSSPENT